MANVSFQPTVGGESFFTSDRVVVSAGVQRIMDNLEALSILCAIRNTAKEENGLHLLQKISFEGNEVHILEEDNRVRIFLPIEY